METASPLLHRPRINNLEDAVQWLDNLFGRASAAVEIPTFNQSGREEL